MLSLLSPVAVNAQQVVPGSTYRLVPTTVYESRPVTAYRVQEQTVVEQKPVTTYKTETVTEMREERYRVAKPVVETSEKVERYTVRRPVTKTEMREEVVEQTRYETETRWREERRTVAKPVVETSEREERRTVFRPVTEVEYQDQQYTTMRPVTTTETQWQNMSGYVAVPQYTPGPVRDRLRWLPRTAYVNPETGLATSQRAGFYWVPEQRPGVVNYSSQYVPNYVPTQVQRTSLVPETVTQRVPIQRTRYEEEVQVRKVPVQTYRTEMEEQVRYVPETVRKPVVERFTRKVPVTTTTWEEEEVERRVPVETYRTEYEDRVRKVPVQVQRTVPVQQMMEREKTVRSYVPYQKDELVPRRVMMKEPIPDDCGIITRPLSAISSATTVAPYTVSRPPSESIRTTPWRVISETEDEPPAPAEIADTKPTLPADAEANPEPDVTERTTNKIRGEKPLRDDE